MVEWSSSTLPECRSNCNNQHSALHRKSRDLYEITKVSEIVSWCPIFYRFPIVKLTYYKNWKNDPAFEGR
jgi:hypothetical protein